MSSSPLGLARATVAAGLAGFSCMAAELTAVRLLAPHFGDSAYVWTNVIGVILGALAVGAWLGGRLSGRAGARSRLVGLLAGAGVLLAIVPYVAGPLGAWLLPATLPLDAAMPAIVRGSLAETLVVFAPPMVLLGAVAPLLVTVLSSAGIAVGRAAGGVSASGTLGSLVGTFAATHWLVPSFGCRMTLTLAGVALVVAAVLLLQTRRAGGALGIAVVSLSAFGHGGYLRAPPKGSEVLAERETRYQYLQVLREPNPAGDRTLLVINEGLDSFHSIAVAGSCFTGGAYYDWHALAPLLVDTGNASTSLRALSIGDAAGSLRTVYAGVHPGLPVDAVDIDPVCMELGALHFPGVKAAGDVFAMDGRVFLQQAQRQWNVIHVDAYAHQVYVPAHLSSQQFFAEVAAHLAPGGVLACNVGALRSDDLVLRAIGTTVKQVFGHAIAIQVPRSRNYLVVARKGTPPDVSRLAGRADAGTGLGAADAEHWRSIVQDAADASRWVDVGTGGTLLDDDRPVLDELLNGSYVAHRDPAVAVVCNGSRDASGAEIDAYAAAKRCDWTGVLAVVATSRTATPYLRQLAGDARWSLRELQAARCEYEQGLALTVEAEERARLQDRLLQLAADQEPLLVAEKTASRNGWLAGLLLAVALVAGTFLRRWV